MTEKPPIDELYSKCDKSRLLSDEQMIKAIISAKLPNMGEKTLIHEVYDVIAKAQDAKTASIVRAEWEQKLADSKTVMREESLNIRAECEDKIGFLIAQLTDKDVAINDLKALLEMCPKAERKKIGEWLKKWTFKYSCRSEYIVADMTEELWEIGEKLLKGEMP